MTDGNSFQVTLPWPPSSNNLFAGKRRRYISPAYKRWRKTADVTIMAARPPQIVGAVEVDIDLTPPNRRRRDCDNFVKPVIDAAVRMRIIEDDNHRIIRRVNTRWHEPAAATAGAVLTIRCV